MARSADALTVGEVVRFVEGSQAGNDRRLRKANLPFIELWQQVDRAISGVLDKTTFGDILRSWTEKQNKYVLNWEI